MKTAISFFINFVFVHTGGWREREKAREESWGPPRDSGSPNEDDHDGDDRQEGERFRERRPPRYSCVACLISRGLESCFENAAFLAKFTGMCGIAFTQGVRVFVGRTEAGGEAALTSPAVGVTLDVMSMIVKTAANAVTSEIDEMNAIVTVITGPRNEIMMMVKLFFLYIYFFKKLLGKLKLLYFSYRCA